MAEAEFRAPYPRYLDVLKGGLFSHHRVVRYIRAQDAHHKKMIANSKLIAL